MIRSFVGDQPNLWETKLPFVMSAYNNSINTVTNKSPFELVFGKTQPLPFSVSKHPIPSYLYDDYSHDLRENLRYAWNSARDKLIQRKEKNKQYYDEKNKTESLDLKIGDLVLMQNMYRQTKFDPKYTGPYEVIELTGPNSVKLKNKNKIIRSHKNKLKIFNHPTSNEDDI